VAGGDVQCEVLAVPDIAPAGGGPGIRLGISRAPAFAEEAYAFGFPLGYSRGLRQGGRNGPPPARCVSAWRSKLTCGEVGWE
jgi:hypothetical protein